MKKQDIQNPGQSDTTDKTTLSVKPATPETTASAWNQMKNTFVFAHPDVAKILEKDDEAERHDGAAHLATRGMEMLQSLAPNDPHEMLLMQHMVLSQEWMTACFREASLYMKASGMPTVELGVKMANLGAKFMALYTKQLEALDKHRHHNPTTSRLRDVNVHQGGNAIIGDVAVTNQGEHAK